MVNTYKCVYCSAGLPTAQGLHSHLAQSQRCRARHCASIAESASDSDSQLGENEPEDNLPPYIEVNPGPAEDDLEEPRQQLRHATVEDSDEDLDNNIEDSTTDSRCYIEDFPRPAGLPLYAEKTRRSSFEQYLDEQKKAGDAPWAPFESEDEWELARWLMTSGVSQTKMDSFLKLNKVSCIVRNPNITNELTAVLFPSKIKDGANPAFHNTRSLLQRIDLLPEGPEWTCSAFRIKGDQLDGVGNLRTEDVELWHRNPVECIKELMGNPAFNRKQGYAPQKVYKNNDGTNREYSEMWTGNWWWNLQVEMNHIYHLKNTYSHHVHCQEELPDGVTICPVSISSDKTSLTQFSGDKQAWPVYLTIGNIGKETRRQPTSRATVLIEYIPVCSLNVFPKKTVQLKDTSCFMNAYVPSCNP
jgi:hypothetical protein